MLRVACVTLAVLAVLPAAALADSIELPTPEAARVAQSNLILAVGGRPDRLLRSDVPGRVVNDETVLVGLGGDGGVRTVEADQRLQLEGEGDYSVRERGPARSARSLTAEPPPVTQRGAVVWQGFSPGRRDLAARLVLDPLIEAPHLPLTVRVSFTDAKGRTGPLPDGGRVPGRGTVTVTLTDATAQPAQLPTAADADPSVLAPALDRALAVARRPSAARLPSTDAGLPKALPVTGAAAVQGSQAVPLRVTGALHLTGTTGTVTGPATTPAAGGASFAGTLGGVRGTPSVTFTAQVAGAGALGLDLTAVAALNPAELVPPDGFPTWRAWAAARPAPAARKAALDLLVEVAATGARASSYSPYLGADLSGTGSTTFRWAFAPAVRTAAAAPVLHPRWGPIGVLTAGLLALLAGATVVWRRS
ncbi:MAG: hypothetical protein ACXVFU_17490 [Nocardioidaceae bacterium]